MNEMRSAECGVRNELRKKHYRHRDTESAVSASFWTSSASSAVKIVSFCCLFFFSMPLSLTSQAYALSGREVYEKVHDVRSRSLDRKTEATMVLFDKGGGKRTRTLIEYSKKADPEAYKVLVVFKSPPDLKNVGFLIHAHTFAERDLWAYFPESTATCRLTTCC